MNLIRVAIILTILCSPFFSNAQLKWVSVDSLFGPLPKSVHVYKTTDSLNGKPNIAYYLEADLRDKKLRFTTDTTLKRRLSPSKFYEKNNNPLVVVNTSFFSFSTNQNLSVVIKDGRLVGYNVHTINGRGKDTFTYRHPFGSALGITKKRKADIAWIHTDSSNKIPNALQKPVSPLRDSIPFFTRATALHYIYPPPAPAHGYILNYSEWKMQTAVGGGPVLIQNGEISITNDQELKFAGKAIDDKHPRTGMGYTKDGKLIILVIEGRSPGKAEGANLTQEAQIFKDLGCWEALNLDGGGSTCMLVNGKETIKVSDASGQRPVPAVFIIKHK
jgi:Phosphodiester glycosidase